MKIYIVMEHWVVPYEAEGDRIDDIYEEKYDADFRCLELNEANENENVDYHVEEWSVK